jgi:hypothetical protein
MNGNSSPSNRYPSGEVFNTGRMLIFLVAAGILAIIVFKYFKGSDSFSNIPKEVQIKYVPADFQFEVDDQFALAVLSNPYRYSREFDQLIRDFNIAMVKHVANRMNLSDSLKAKVVEAYDQHHPYIKQLMFNDFVALKDSSAALYDAWYANEMSNAVDALYEVSSKYTCFIINQILATLLKTDEGKIYVKGDKVNTPCGVALSEALQPMITRLKVRASIDDFSRSKGIMMERVERTIAELGTMEVRDRKGIGASKQTSVLGFDVSSTEMEMSAISILKVGFKLDKFFDINLSSKSGIVNITLPEPEILSHEVYPRIDKLDIGWMRELDMADFNKNMDLLRREFRRDALESDIMEKAKQRAAELMETWMLPVIKGMNGRFKVKVSFKNVNQQPAEEQNGKTPDN